MKKTSSLIVASLSLLAACTAPEPDEVRHARADSIEPPSDGARGEAAFAWADPLMADARAASESDETGTRDLAVLAFADFVYYRRTNDPEYRRLGLRALDTVLDRSSTWARSWLSSITASHVLFAAWVGWSELDVDDPKTGGRDRRLRLETLAGDEASFWTWAWTEAVARPRELTIPRIAANPWQLPNRCLITGDMTGSDLGEDHPDVVAARGCMSALTDTKAEETSAIAMLLSLAGNMYAARSDAAGWLAAGRAYAAASLSTGRAYDAPPSGTFTRTMGLLPDGDWVIGNHGGPRDPGYTIAAIAALQQGAFVYEAAGRPVPAEYRTATNVSGARFTESYVWQKNVEPCLERDVDGALVRERFKNPIEPGRSCNDGQQPAVLAFPLAYWAIVDGDASSRQRFDQQNAGLVRFGVFDDASISAREPVEKNIQVATKAWLYAHHAAIPFPADAVRTEAGPLEAFRERIALRTSDGAYLQDANIMTSGDDGATAVFTLVGGASRYLRDGDSIMLRGASDTYLCADETGGGAVRAGATTVDYACRFTIHKVMVDGDDRVIRTGDRVGLSITKLVGDAQGADGAELRGREVYLSATPDGVVMDRPWQEAWETFTIEPR